MESPKSNSYSKSYYSDDNDSIEELLLYLINECIKLFSFSEIKELSEILKISLIKELLLKMYIFLFILTLFNSDSHFQALFFETNSKIETVSSLDYTYPQMNLIITSMDNYFVKKKEIGFFKFIADVNLKEMININNLINNSKLELHKFINVFLVAVSISENRELFLDKVSENAEKYLDGYLDIIQKYIDLSEENTTDNINLNKRRFTTRSSVLFNFKDSSMLFASIDKLRKTIVNLQVEKESLLKSLSKSEEDKNALNHQIDVFQSMIALFKIKEDELNMEIQDYKVKIYSFNTNDQSMMNNEMLLVEKSQQLSQLEETSTLKISSLNQKIASLQKEILDMHMVNEQSSQLCQENQTLKDELNRIQIKMYDEIEPLKQENTLLQHKIYDLERDNNNYQSKIIVLRNDLKVEKQKTEVQNKTITALQNKFKKIETKPVAVIHDFKPLPEEINEDRIKELLMKIQEKELMICDLNQEISKLKQKIEIPVYQIQEKILTKVIKKFEVLKSNHCIGEEFIYTSSIPSKDKISKETIKLRDEIKRRDRDIAFLKKAYSELKAKSEEEYNMVSSSLYELALHLTKIKDEVYVSSNNSNNKEIVKAYEGIK